MSISALKEKFNSLTLESENHWDYRGNNNSERDYVHGFCTYPAMMVPKMQREMLDVCLEHLQDTSIRLLDPFAGSGTILVEGMLRGLNIVGIDINPLAILLCKAKTTILNPTTLHEKTVQLFAWITIHDKTPLYKFDGINKWFTNQLRLILSRNMGLRCLELVIPLTFQEKFLRSNEFCGISSILYYYAILQVCFTGQLVHN